MNLNTLAFQPIQQSINLGQGAEISIETGRIAKQAAGAVVIRQGDTMVLVAVCHAVPRQELDYFPLSVDYREAVFAAGKIPGGWFKREGKATTKETLTSRLIDRPLRPLFEEGYNAEVMVTAQVISYDGIHAPETLAMTGASAALIISEIPFHQPVGGVRVGRIQGQFVINPTIIQRKESDLDLLIAGTKDAIVMVECGAQEVDETDMVQALVFGHNHIKTLAKFQEDFKAKVGKPKVKVEKKSIDTTLLQTISSTYRGDLLTALTLKNKLESYKAIDQLKATVVETHTAEQPERKGEVKACFDHLKESIFREMIL
ncbi:MAG: polyribonucleotide nucleotidyltransferase, partial [Holophagaceae bacterium]